MQVRDAVSWEITSIYLAVEARSRVETKSGRMLRKMERFEYQITKVRSTLGFDPCFSPKLGVINIGKCRSWVGRTWISIW
jgi:hypothetical protein